MYKHIPNFDYLFNDKAFIKGFIWQLVKTCNELKIETNNQFYFIFEKENQKKTNIYHLIDIDILNIAFIDYLKTNNNDFNDEVIELYLKNKNYFEINLICSLAKINLLYYNFNNFKNYSMCRYTKTDFYIVNFKGVAIKLDQIIDIVDDKIISTALKKMVKSNYSYFYKKRKKNSKQHNYFNPQTSKKYKEIFWSINNES